MELNYKRFGSGEPLLVLHGLLGMLDNWMAPAKELSEHFDVWLLDARNHGHSFHHKEHNYAAMMEDLKTFVDDHNLHHFHLLGHSMGGKTAMKFAQNYPEFIMKLIVADIAPKAYPVHHQKILEGLKSVDFAKVNSRSDVDAILAKYIDEAGVRQFLGKNLYWIEKGKLAWRFNLEAISQNIEIIGEAVCDRMFDGETLFINGELSNYIQKSDIDDILLSFPNASFGHMPESGHWVHADNPELFIKLVLDFLKK